MLGRIYTFEHPNDLDGRPIVEPLSPAVLRAISLAMSNESGIRFEELTDFDNPRPMVVVLFSDRQTVTRFDRKLRQHLENTHVSVKVMGTSLGRAEASAPGLDTATQAA